MARIRRLNRYQKAAVAHRDGPAIVFAGAGAGKTAVIEHRTARLLAAGADPARILPLTFTNKAADEMLKRVGEIHPAAAMIEGGTFHSWARKLLVRHGSHVGLKRGFTILDEDDAKTLIAETSLDIAKGFSGRNLPSDAVILKVISHARNNQLKIKASLAKVAPVSKALFDI